MDITVSGKGNLKTFNGGKFILSRKEVIVQWSTMVNFMREGAREFLPLNYKEIRLTKLKKACVYDYSKIGRFWNLLATNLGPSCNHIIDQLTNLKLIYSNSKEHHKILSWVSPPNVGTERDVVKR